MPNPKRLVFGTFLLPGRSGDRLTPDVESLEGPALPRVLIEDGEVRPLPCFQNRLPPVAVAVCARSCVRRVGFLPRHLLAWIKAVGLLD